MAIERVWHGWTNREQAGPYQELLHEEVFPAIEAKKIAGYRGIRLLRRELQEEVEFVTIMTFDSLQSVVDFQGEDYQRSYVPSAARALLSRWDETAAHYEVIETRNYD